MRRNNAIAPVECKMRYDSAEDKKNALKNGDTTRIDYDTVDSALKNNAMEKDCVTVKDDKRCSEES